MMRVATSTPHAASIPSSPGVELTSSTSGPRAERINTLLTRAHEDSRQICQHTRSTGSNMPKSRCLTVAERRRIEEKGKALLNDQRTFNNFNPASSR